MRREGRIRRYSKPCRRVGRNNVETASRNKITRFKMTDQSSLEEIAKLLLKYPGITSAVVFRISESNRVRVRFRCADAASLKSIASCAVWANVTIKLGNPDTRICAEREQSSDLPCDITFVDNETEIPTQPQIFGVWLSNDLEHKGLISTEECQRLHSGWNTKLNVHRHDQ